MKQYMHTVESIDEMGEFWKCQNSYEEKGEHEWTNNH